jgi:hypothetical protein
MVEETGNRKSLSKNWTYQDFVIILAVHENDAFAVHEFCVVNQRHARWGVLLQNLNHN